MTLLVLVCLAALASMVGFVLAAAFARAVLYKNVLVEVDPLRVRRTQPFPRPRFVADDGELARGVRSSKSAGTLHTCR